MKMKKTTLKKSTKEQSQKSELINDKKKIIIVISLLFLAAIMCGFIIWRYFSDLNYVFLQTNNHICVYPLDEFNKIEPRYNVSQLHLLLPFLICGIAAAVAINIKIRLVRYMFIIVAIALIAVSYISINTSTQKVVKYYNENKYTLKECP